jgi:dTDP-4-amino-4,6-dideoxygalactose transaminase
MNYPETARIVTMLHRLQEAHIQTCPLWQPLHLSAAHHGAWATDCSVAEHLYREALSLPCSVGLDEAGAQRVVGELGR